MNFPGAIGRFFYSKNQQRADSHRTRVRRALRKSRGFNFAPMEPRLLLSADIPVEAAVVMTDKPDYAPGETAIITAFNSGAEGMTFQSGEQVEFQVTRADGVVDNPLGNLPWHVTDGVGGFDGYYVDANDDGTFDYGVFPDMDVTENGSFATTWMVEGQYAGASLLLTATGHDSGAVATTTFSEIANVAPDLGSPAIVMTDKADYAPGETAIITAFNGEADGLKFQSGEQVKFQVSRTDGIEENPLGNLPWFVTDGVGGFDGYYVDTNDDGAVDYGVFPDTDLTVNESFSTTWLVEDQYLGATLLLTATGQESGAVATTEFTDAVNVAPHLGLVSVTSSINENGTATLSGTFFDPDTLDTHTIVLNWNSGGNVGGPGEGTTTITTAGPNPAGTTLTSLGGGNWSFNATHQYLDDNPTGTLSDVYTVKVVSLTDNNGGSAFGSGAAATIDFSSGVYSSIFSSNDRYLEDGFLFRPRDNGDHTDSGISQGYYSFHDGAANTPPNFIDVTMGGAPFSLSSFDVRSDLSTSGLPLSLTNSNGDTFTVSTVGTHTPPVSQNWTNITSFSMRSLALNSLVFVDNFVFNGAPSLPLNVTNVAPVANAGADQTVNEGALVTLNGSFTDVGTNDGHKQEWSVVASNGQVVTGLTINPTATGDSNGSDNSSFSFTPNDNGTYTVTYKVTDDDTGLHSDTSVITVNNVAPTTLGLSLSATTINENGSTTLSGSFVDPGTLDTHSVTINWGDGSSNTMVNLAVGVLSFSGISHQYLDDNPTGTAADTYTIGVTVSDDDTGSTTGSTSVTVNNLAPSNVVLTLSSNSIIESGSTTLGGSFTDPGTLDTHTVDINWGDGSPNSNVNLGAGVLSFSGVSHQYAEERNTPYTITATVRDDDSGSGSGTTSITVNDAPLTAVALTPPVATEGLPFSNVTVFHFTDANTHPDIADYTATVNTGDAILTSTANTGNVQIVANAGGFDVKLSYTYVEELTNATFSVQVTDVGGAAVSLAIPSSQTIVSNGTWMSSTVIDDGGPSGNWTPLRFVPPAATTFTNGVSVGNTAGVDGTDQAEIGGGALAIQSNKNTYFYRTTFVLPSATGLTADITLSVDNDAQVFINGQEVAREIDFLAANFSNPYPHFRINPDGTISNILHFDQTSNFTNWVAGVNELVLAVRNPNSELNPAGGFVFRMDLSSSNTFSVADPAVVATGGFTYTVNEAATLANVLVAKFTDPGNPTGTTEAATDYSATIDWQDGSSPAPGTIVNNGDGTFNVYGSHVYSDDNPTNTASDNYVIDVAITHEATAVVHANSTITVNNVAPSTLSLSATTINENGSTTLTGSFADPGTLDTHSVAINWGDGSSNTVVNLAAGVLSFNSISHQYLDDNPTGTAADSYTIGVTVSDDDTGSTTASTSVTVNNVAPVVNPLSLSATTINENGSVTVTGSYTDVGTLDTHTVMIDWGVGQTASAATVNAANKTFTATHQYLDDGASPGNGNPSDTYTIKATVTDDDTLFGTASATLTVNNVAPSTLGLSLSATTINESGSTTLNGSFADPGTLDTHSVTINWGDGSSNTIVNLAAAVLSFSGISHQYLDNGSPSYAIQVTVADDDSGSVSASTSVVVDNVTPMLTISGAASVNEAAVYTLNLSSSDPGADSISQWFVDWGDGSDPDGNLVVGQIVAGNPSLVTHVYADGTRSHTILAWATDEDGTYPAQTLGANAIVSLDPSFGNAGVVKHDFLDSTSDSIRDSVITLADGKILVVGTLSGGISRIGMARYNSDGTLDLTFGTGGSGITEFDLSQSAESVVIDGNGKILVAGSDGIARYNTDGSLDTSFGIGGLNNTFTGLNKIVLDGSGRIVVSSGNRLARLLANGTVDASFDSDGQVSTSTMTVQDFTLDAVGNLIVVGYIHNGSNYDIAVRRYNTLGQLDTGYGTGGTATFDFGGNQGDLGRAVALHGAGVVIAGQAADFNFSTNTWVFYDQVVIRLDASGNPDSTFGTAGIVRNGIGGPLAFRDPSVMKVDSLNRILVGSQNTVARYLANGALDATFDTDGVQTSVGGLNSIEGLVFDSSGRIVVGGTRFNGVSSGSGNDFAVARLNASNGSLDTTFGVGGNDGNGVVTTDFVGSTSDAVADLVEILPDGKILAAGSASGGTSDILLARYLPNGTLDTTFAAGDGDGVDGFAITDFGGSESATSLAVDSLGRIYVSYSNVIIRYNSNGIRDTSYGTSLGRAFTGLNTTIAKIAVDANDKLVAAGAVFRTISGIGSQDFGVTRLLSTGAVDSTFGVSGIGSLDVGTTGTVKSDDYVQAMVIDASGAIVVTGYSYKYTPPLNTFVSQNTVTARFSSSGVLDGTFGSGGFIETNLGFSSTGQSLAIDNLDRIVVSTSNRLLRFGATGLLDSSFDGDGIVITVATASRVAIDQAGKIVTAGGNSLARYNDNGTPDTTFAPGGKITTVPGSVQALLIDDLNRIVVGGQSTTTTNTGADFLVARYITQGLSVTVLNLSPQITSFTAPTTGVEGTAFNLAVTTTDPAGAADPLTYSWNITRNGSPYQIASGSAITVTPVDNGNYVATVTVNDGDGGIVSSNRTIVVSNVAPIGTFNAPASVNEGSSFTLSITAQFDPSDTDTTVGFQYAFDFGSGFGAYGSSNSASFTPADNGLLAVKGKIRDKDGGETTYTGSVTINNVAPTLTVVGNQSVDEGVLLSLTNLGVITDPGFDNAILHTVETFSYSIDWGDGTTLVTGAATIDDVGAAGDLTDASFDGSHIYADDGVFTVRVRVADDDMSVGAYVEQSFQVTVRNVETVSIAAIADGAEATTPTNGKFRVTQTGTSSTNSVVSYTVNLTSTATPGVGNDYTTLSGSVTILAGTTSADIDVMVLNDAIVEGTETVIVTLSGVSGEPGITLDADAADRTATVNITDNDTATYTISDAAVTEGGNLSFTVSLSNPVDVNTTVYVTFTDGTTSAGDFTHTLVPVTFLAGNNIAQVILVATSADSTVEADETLTAHLALSTPLTGGRLSNTSDTGTGTITNDDTATYTISDATITEGGNLSFTVLLSNAVDVDTTVNVTFTDGTTSAGDFTHTLVPVTFLAGNNTAQVILVVTSADSTVEADETLTAHLALSTPLTGGRLSNTSDTGTGTITNDDTATLSISAPTINETNADFNVNFVVTLDHAVEGGFDVAISATNGTAGGTDYTLNTTTLHFAGTVGESHNVSVTIKGDTIVEANETFTVNLGDVTGTSAAQDAAITSTATATGTINNNDSATLSISAPTITETNADFNVNFAVTLDHAVEGGFDVAIGATNATAGSVDYTLNTTTLHFNGTVGESHDVSVTIKGDTVVESNETFSVNLGTVSNTSATQIAAITSTASAAGTINNNDTATLTITVPTITETDVDQTTLTFTVGVNAAVQDGFKVAFSDLLSGTATVGADYTVDTASPLTFTGTAGEAHTISLTIKGDDIFEGNETFTLQLGDVTDTTSVQDAAITTGAQATATINNDDTATLTITNITQTETDSDFIVQATVTLSAAVEGGFALAYSSALGTAEATDVTVAGSSLNFAGTAGEFHTIDITIKGDDIVEDNETFSITLGDVTGTSAVQDAAITTGTVSSGLINNDDTATLSISAPSITESDADFNVNFAVTLDHEVQGGFDVAISSTNGTAGGTDYTLNTTTLHFTGTAGESHNVSVTIKGDLIVEANETFSVQLGDVTNNSTVQDAAITTGASATGTITNDDSATLTLSSVSATNLEGNSGTTAFTFNVTLSNDVQGGVTVAYTTNDGTATAADGDYVDNDGSLVFTGIAGETKTITVLVNGDTKVEANETFTVALGAITGLVAGVPGGTSTITTAGSPQTGTINNDDTATYTISDATVTEGGNLSFTVYLSNPVDVATTVNVSFADVSTSADDFNHATQQVTFAANTTTAQTVTVGTTADSTVEADETLTASLALSAALTGGRLSNTTDMGTGTITNDDSTTLTITAPLITETNANQSVNFVVNSSNAVQGGFTLAFTSAGVTATPVTDFSVTTLSPLSFAGTANENQNIAVTIVGDTIVEANETFTITLGAATGGAGQAAASFVPSGSPATGTINNDDTATYAISDATITEGGNLSFTVYLSNPVDVATTLNVSFADVSTSAGDFNHTTQSVTFTALDTANKTVTVGTVDDTNLETSETLTASLALTTPLTGGRLSNTGDTGSGTIIDNESATLAIATISSATEAGGAQSVGVVTLTITGTGVGTYALGTGISLTADVTQTGGTAISGTDYSAFGTQTVTFNGGATSGAMRNTTLTVTDDHLLEVNETVNLLLGNLGGSTVASSLGNTANTTTISDNESATLAIAATSSATEAGGAQSVGVVTLTFTGTGTGTYALGSGITLTADVTDAGGGTTTSGSDYTAFGTQTVTFNGGATSGSTFNTTLTSLEDTLVEGNETVKLQLQNLGKPATVAASLGTIYNTTTITDNDTATLAIETTKTVTEQGGAQTITVTLTTTDGGAGTATLASGVTLTADVADLTSGTATSGILNDYSFSTQTVSFGPGSGNAATRTVTLTPTNDITVEVPNETVNLKLQNLNTTLNGQASLGNVNSTVTIADNDTTSTLTVSTPKQYSDLVTFTATLSPAIVQGSAPASSVTFYVGTQNMGTVSLVAGGGILTGTLTVPLLETVAGQMAPGARTVTAVFGGVNSNATVNNATTTLTITKEDADITYTGQTYVTTASPTVSTVTVPLEAVIRDITSVPLSGDPNAGAILNASVTFTIYDAFTGSQIGGAITPTLGLIGSDTGIAMAQASFTANLGSANAAIYRVRTTVNNYYIDVEDTLITVAKPIDNTINGGGYIVASSSAGSYMADVSSKENFGINISYNKNMTNVQGKVNVIFRRTESGVVHTYQIKSNATGALSVDPTTGIATFTAKANLIDITNEASPVTIGNYDLLLKVDDNGEPGTGSNGKGNDQYSLRLMNGTTLIFASSWNGVQTQLQTLDGGNIQVRPYSETLISFVNGIQGDQTITEGNTGTQNLVFTVKLSQASTQTVKVNYSTADNSATAGGAVPDYVSTSGTLTFAPGEITKTITIVVKGDTLDEPDETFFVNLSNPIQAGIQDPTAIGLILDNDLPAPLLVDGGTATDGGAENLSADAAQPLLAAAIEQMRATGVNPLWLNSLAGIEVRVADLPDSTLGLASQGVIVLDRDAAGYGWFIDKTPFESDEFQNLSGTLIAGSESDAYGRMDLLTTVMHEIGHLLGYDHGTSELMGATLGAGVRELEAITSSSVLEPSYLPVGISEHANNRGVEGFSQSRLINWDSEFSRLGQDWNQDWQKHQSGAGFPEFSLAGFDNREPEFYGLKKKRLDELSEEVEMEPMGQIDWHIDIG